MALPEQLIVFPGAKIDGRRVKVEREPNTGQVYGVAGFLSGPLQGAPEEAAYEFLSANQRLFQSTPGILRELQVEKVSRSPAGYHVVFQQVHEGLPVEEAQVSVHMTRDKRIHAATSRLRPQVAAVDVKTMARDGIDQHEAICVAAEHLQVDEAPGERARAEQVIFAETEPTVAWKVFISTREPRQEWTVWVNALTGNVLRQRQVTIE